MNKLIKTLTLAGMLGAAAPAITAFADEPLRPDNPDRPSSTRNDDRDYERRDDRYHARNRAQHYRRDDRDPNRAAIAQTQAYIWELEKRAWADGYVSSLERERIERAKYALALRERQYRHRDNWR